jgi:hypothetical protein
LAGNHLGGVAALGHCCARKRSERTSNQQKRNALYSQHGTSSFYRSRNHHYDE